MRSKIKKLFWFLIAFSAVFACVEEINFTTPEFYPKLVVEGGISTIDKNPSIQIHYTSDYTTNPNDFKVGEFVGSASVFIRDVTTSENFDLKHKGSGVYESDDPAFRGIVGHEYYLEFQFDSKTYRSETVLIEPVADIDDIYYEFIPDNNTVGVYIDMQDPEEPGNAYQWKWTGYYQVLTILPGPPAFPDTFTCCQTCYRYVNGYQIGIKNDSYINGNKIEKQLVATLPMDDVTDFLVEVEQHSLSDDAYNFWNKVRIQWESEGSLFDPSPFNIQGNITNISDPDEVVLGYFSGSDVSMKHIQVRRSDFSRAPPKRPAEDCRNLFYTSTEIPANWK